jgi:hypothetical protein
VEVATGVFDRVIGEKAQIVATSYRPYKANSKCAFSDPLTKNQTRLAGAASGSRAFWNGLRSPYK